MAADEIAWIEIGSVPLEAHVHDWHHDPEHPLTPQSVRQRSARVESHFSAVVWKQVPYVGIIIGITERTWNQNDLLSVELSYTKPGRGAGHVAVTVTDSYEAREDHFIINTKQYDERAVLWCRKLMAALASIGVETKEEDQGIDA